MGYRDSTDYIGGREVSLNISLVIVSTLLLVARVFARTRITRSFGYDDGTACVAYVRGRAKHKKFLPAIWLIYAQILCLAQSSLDIYGVCIIAMVDLTK